MTDDDFIKTQNKEATTQAVADVVGMTYHATAQRATRLRRKGHKLERKYLSAEEYSHYGKRGGRPRVKHD